MPQPTPLTFRIATPDDVTHVLSLVRSAYRGDASRAGWTTEADLVADDRIDEAGVLEKINEPKGSILLAFDPAGALAACCELVKRDDKLAYFGLFAVDPLRQAGGIGKQVLAKAEAHAKDVLGVSRLEMWVIFLREELISWYERRGYTRTDKMTPFTPEHLINGKALRDDLQFLTLVKDL